MSDNVTVLEYQGREIHLLGTAHVSRASVDEVVALIEKVQPDTVCVELDATRYEAMTDEDRWKKLNIFQVIRDGKVLFLLSSLVLTGYQRKLGEQFGVEPGAELMAAVSSAEKVGAELVLADRNIQATLKRSWAALSFFNKVNMVGAMMGGFFGSEEITEEKIEQLKDRDTISEVMGEFANAIPGLHTPLIDERDRYLMSHIQEAPGKTIVAVVGAGHVEGMQRYLGATVDREKLSKIPPTPRSTKLLKWVIPALMMSAFYYGYTKHSGEDFTQMIYAWVLPNSVMAALCTLVVRARFLTVLTAFVASPITSLNPTIGAGMVAGLMEAWLLKPTVEDCELINRDMTSFTGLRRNRFTRVLLVFVAATMGSAMGAWIGVSWVAWLL
ncbi:MAG: TraB/GumN family protein [Polyangiaceae bacterium]|nr:TraB/GumN family protein [Polyangiaceae bacterium]